MVCPPLFMFLHEYAFPYFLSSPCGFPLRRGVRVLVRLVHKGGALKRGVVKVCRRRTYSDVTKTMPKIASCRFRTVPLGNCAIS